MERAGKALRQSKLLGKIPAEELARSAWSAAVGKTIARHSEAIALIRGRLVVEVEDQLWRRNLYELRAPILSALHKLLGDGVVETLEFRIPAKRMPPRMEAAPHSVDEANQITDGTLRVIYKQSRKKASA